MKKYSFAISICIALVAFIFLSIYCENQKSVMVSVVFSTLAESASIITLLLMIGAILEVTSRNVDEQPNEFYITRKKRKKKMKISKIVPTQISVPSSRLQEIE